MAIQQPNRVFFQLLLVPCAIGLTLVLTGCCGGGDGSVPGASSGDQKEAVKTAKEEAQTWLGLIDDGKYGKSHDKAATYFQDAVDKEAWKKQIKGVRKPLGALESRKVSSATYTTSAPGAPDGEYVIIIYNASYKNKKVAVETVTPMKQEDGSWAVSGYYIR